MSYFATHSDKLVDFNDLDNIPFCLEDIAHHLTKICRFGGALPFNEHYSVAEHSINLVQYAYKNGHNIDIQKALLMHDATEAYLGDMVTGVKSQCKDYQDLELKVDNLLRDNYNIPKEGWVKSFVNQLDKRIVLDEAKLLRPDSYELFVQTSKVKPLGISISRIKNMQVVYSMFLILCHKLGIKDKS